jgi:hypothetical protein
MLGNKNFYKKCKNQQLFNKKDFFSFQFSKISCSKHKGISLNLRATYALNALQKLMKKDFFLAIDAATQSSNKEVNEKDNNLYFFILVLNEATKGKCRQAQNQENKIKLCLKAQIAKNQSKDAQWQSRKHRLLRLSKNHKTNFLFFFFSINNQLRKTG